MSSLQAHYKDVEHDYGQDVLTFVVVRGYISKLTAKASIARFLKSKVPDVFEQFMLISNTLCLDDTGSLGDAAPERGELSAGAEILPAVKPKALSGQRVGLEARRSPQR